MQTDYKSIEFVRRNVLVGDFWKYKQKAEWSLVFFGVFFWRFLVSCQRYLEGDSAVATRWIVVGSNQPETGRLVLGIKEEIKNKDDEII